MLKKTFAVARAAGFALLAAATLSACATRGYVDEQIAATNARVDAVDQRVQSATQRMDATATEARTANQRLDQLEGRVSQLERAPARRPRG